MKLAALGGYKPEALPAGRLVRAPRILDTEGHHRARAALTGLYTEDVIDAAIRALEAVGASSVSPELLRLASSFVTDVRLASIDDDSSGVKRPLEQPDLPDEK